MRVPLFTFFLFFSLFSYSNEEDYEVQQTHDIEYYIDCGIPEGSVRGGQFSKHDLDCWCDKNKSQDRNEALKYFGIGTVLIIILTVVIKRSKESKNEIDEFEKLRESINGILLTLFEIEDSILKTNTIEQKLGLKQELTKIQLLIETTVVNRVEKYKWDELKPINISAISNNSTTVGIAINRISNKLNELIQLVYSES